MCPLRVWIQNNLKWDKQVDVMIDKAGGRLVMLCKLKRAQLPVLDLLQIYIAYVRPVLEYSVPVWQPGLTSTQTVRLERVQKRALRTDEEVYSTQKYKNMAKEVIETCRTAKLSDTPFLSFRSNAQ
ncbi:hypothetical protein Bbelb_192840 [Branchiostoma belcheri]|nr:hypothetical protein Bbelb_192840 [Branchiostoma belcheri]